MRTIIRQAVEDAQRSGDPHELYTFLELAQAGRFPLEPDEGDEIADTLGDLQAAYYADLD